MNCGNCLVESARVVQLDANGFCPVCATRYPPPRSTERNQMSEEFDIGPVYKAEYAKLQAHMAVTNKVRADIARLCNDAVTVHASSHGGVDCVYRVTQADNTGVFFASIRTTSPGEGCTVFGAEIKVSTNGYVQVKTTRPANFDPLFDDWPRLRDVLAQHICRALLLGAVNPKGAS